VAITHGPQESLSVGLFRPHNVLRLSGLTTKENEVNDRELNADGPSPLESLVRPEERAASDVPQDISPEAILAILEQEKRFWENLVKRSPHDSYYGCLTGLNIAMRILRERMDANSMPPG
jgi:hypothetical protein